MLDQDVRRIEDKFKQRTIVNRDRRTGDTPLVVVQVGDVRYAWVGSGAVAAGASSTLYLTLNGQSGGEAIFKRCPLVVVGRDLAVTAAGVATASGPLALTQDWSIGMRNGEVDYDVKYMGQIKTFAVVVTNLMGTSQNFVVVAQGVA